MKEVDRIALAGLLHDIGKFGQRAQIEIGEYDWQTYCPNYNGYYSHKHAAFTAKILGDLIIEKQKDHPRIIDADALESEFINISAKHHKPESKQEWIVAAADRLASGFERETFETYNEKVEEEIKTSHKEQQLDHLFVNESKFALDRFEPDHIFPTDEKGRGYQALWRAFEEDVSKINSRYQHYPMHLKVQALEYLLKRYTSFIPSATSFRYKDNDITKPNIPLYEHLKTTAIFSSAIASMREENRQKVIDYYQKRQDRLDEPIFLLIAGDFFGIQHFIFDDVQTKYAAKTLRAKSAYIQLLIKALAYHVCETLEISTASIIATHAGKFEILAPNEPAIIERLHLLQVEFNEHFIKEFFGTTGVGLAYQEATIGDFLLKDEQGVTHYKKLREKLANQIEAIKFQKFDLAFKGYHLFTIDEGIDNQNLCNFCHKRKGEKKEEYVICRHCDRFVRIGQKLTKHNYIAITKRSKNENDIALFGDLYLHFFDKPSKAFAQEDLYIFDISKDPQFHGMEKWELSSYVATDAEGEIATLEDLATMSVLEGREEGRRDYGVEAIMALKGDGDNMGQFIRESDITDSFAKYNFFAKMIDYYFSVYVPNKFMRDKPLYTVFAGGDDLFVLGAWDAVIDLAQKVRDDFVTFTGGKLTFSVGMVMSKAHKPINFLAQSAEEALEVAKEIDGKDALTLFDETVRWDGYKIKVKINNNYFQLEKELHSVSREFVDTAFLYRMLELIYMRKKINEDIKNTMWKSKFAYTIRRNYEKLPESLINTLNVMIEEYPEVTKIVLNEYIYKRRRS